MVKQIFVNLPVKDLEATKAFWLNLGFTFDPQFTDQNAASLVLGENIYAMLLVPKFFSTFTKKDIADAQKTTEVITAFSLETKEEVDTLMENVLSSGGTESGPTQNYGWMYSRAFADLDGHLWEAVWMDLSKVPTNPGESQLQ
jgi:uncharacterized protein